MPRWKPKRRRSARRLAGDGPDRAIAGSGLVRRPDSTVFDGLRFERVEIASSYDGPACSQAVSALFPLDPGELWIGRALPGGAAF